MTTVVLRGSTSTLTTYPRTQGPVPLLPAVSPTVRVAAQGVSWPDEDTGYAAAGQDTLDQTVTAAADVGATALSITSTNVAVGRKYLLVDSDAVFPVSVIGKGAGVVYLGEPLRRAVSALGKLVGWAVTRALTTTETDLVGPGMAQFKATVGGIAVSWTETFRVARRLPVIPLTADELVRSHPEVKALHARQDETLVQLIESAWEYQVLPKILRREFFPEDIANPEAVKPLLAAACMVHLCRLSRQVTDEYLARWMLEFDRQLEATLARLDWHTAEQVESPPVSTSIAERDRARQGRMVR
jgi:hypothetical protein